MIGQWVLLSRCSTGVVTVFRVGNRLRVHLPVARLPGHVCRLSVHFPVSPSVLTRRMCHIQLPTVTRPSTSFGPPVGPPPLRVLLHTQPVFPLLATRGLLTVLLLTVSLVPVGWLYPEFTPSHVVRPRTGARVRGCEETPDTSSTGPDNTAPGAGLQGRPWRQEWSQTRNPRGRNRERS